MRNKKYFLNLYNKLIFYLIAIIEYRCKNVWINILRMNKTPQRDLWIDFSSFRYVMHRDFWVSNQLIAFANRCVFIRIFVNAKSNENLHGCELFLFDRYIFKCSQQRFICSNKSKSGAMPWMDSNAFDIYEQLPFYRALSWQ